MGRLIWLWSAIVLALASPNALLAQARDNTFLYSGDVEHFVEAAVPSSLFIEGGTLIDGESQAPRPNPGILIENGIISFTTDRNRIGDARKIDANGQWIVPGMFDLAAHLTFYLPGGFQTETGEIAALRGERFLENYQKIGVTTVLDTASRDNVGYSMKRAQRMGLMNGARLFVAGQGLTVSGGHPTEFTPFEDTPFSVEGDGPWEMRKLVRENVRKGADFIMIYPPLTQEEYDAAVDEAHFWKIPVMAFGGGIQDLSVMSGLRAVTAGVDGLQTLYPLGDSDRQRKTIAQMARNDIHSIPIIGYHLRELEGREHIGGHWMRDNIGFTEQAVRSNFEAMRAAGLKFGIGTESNPFNMLQIGDIYLQELQGFETFGFTPMEIIRAATLGSAQFLEIDDSSGSIAEGKRGDLSILARNPLEDLGALVSPRLVVQQGVVAHENSD